MESNKYVSRFLEMNKPCGIFVSHISSFDPVENFQLIGHFIRVTLSSIQPIENFAIISSTSPVVWAYSKGHRVGREVHPFRDNFPQKVTTMEKLPPAARSVHTQKMKISARNWLSVQSFFWFSYAKDLLLKRFLALGSFEREIWDFVHLQILHWRRSCFRVVQREELHNACILCRGRLASERYGQRNLLLPGEDLSESYYVSIVFT
ncbi:hypothetical protein CEXT_551751 [Caerostris extrusa]|uniref:Uncharacterized protein n=1 Tax=Caerostris extrusa TaxID=172846 RepID=A0AAV4U873_CAEEX|nr:hypothetical protein CEXT_551751 [Caerostris extrusa]